MCAIHGISMRLTLSRLLPTFYPTIQCQWYTNDGSLRHTVGIVLSQAWHTRQQNPAYNYPPHAYTVTSSQTGENCPNTKTCTSIFFANHRWEISTWETAPPVILGQAAGVFNQDAKRQIWFRSNIRRWSMYSPVILGLIKDISVIYNVSFWLILRKKPFCGSTFWSFVSPLPKVERPKTIHSSLMRYRRCHLFSFKQSCHERNAHIQNLKYRPTPL